MRSRARHARLALCLAAALSLPASGQEGQSDADLATKLANPVASLVSVPFQLNWDHAFGPDRDGHKWTLNIQPVVPAKLPDDWLLISRVIVPVIDQRVPFIGDGSQSGVGDITGEFFFVPPTSVSGVTFGFGPAVLIPTHVAFLSADKWALGPTAVVLHQGSGWTYGALVNHLWSVAGNGPQDISSTFVQPFLSYTTKDAWTFSVNAESSYDWKASQWTVPINALVSKLTRVGKQPVSLGAGVRWYADSASAGPHGWGVRLVATFLFPQ